MGGAWDGRCRVVSTSVLLGAVGGGGVCGRSATPPVLEGGSNVCKTCLYPPIRHQDGSGQKAADPRHILLRKWAQQLAAPNAPLAHTRQEPTLDLQLPGPRCIAFFLPLVHCSPTYLHI